MNIQERIEALETEFNEKIKTLKAEVQREKEFPQDGDEYWYIDDRGFVGGSLYTNHYIDSGRQTVDNFFSSREQAEFAAEKLKVEAELRKFSRPFEPTKDNYFIIFNMQTGCLDTRSRIYIAAQGTIDFDSYEEVVEAIESVGEERIKKYIFGVED